MSLSTTGEQGNQASLTPAMSRDGDFVAFQSFATNLVAGDTNGVTDVFLRTFGDPGGHLRVPGGWALQYRQRLRRATTRISVSSAGEQADGSSFDRTLAMSADGRFVAFASSASNLVPGDRNQFCDNDFDGIAEENCYDVFLHDGVTGFTTRISTSTDGAEADGRSSSPAISADGQTVAFQSRASNLVPDDTNPICMSSFGGTEHCAEIYVSTPDRTLSADADLNGDGDVDDTLLQVFDPKTGGVRTIAEAGEVAIIGDFAAFLRPDPDGPTAHSSPGPPSHPARPGISNGDAMDYRAHLSHRGGPAQDLQQWARAIALSAEWLAALVPEFAEGADLNGDGDIYDTVLQVHRLGDAAGSWRNVGQAADCVQIAGSTVAFTTPELSGHEGFTQSLELTGDYYSFDRVLQVYDAATETLVMLSDENGVALPVDDYVLGESLLAFRVREQGRTYGQCDENGDGDCLDSVLFIYDLRRQEIVNTRQAATACPLEACQPRFPYRVFDDTVKFLTLESEQQEDLNGDDDRADLVLQIFNVRLQGSAPLSGGGAVVAARTRRGAGGLQPGAVTSIGAVTAGVCTTSGAACVRAEDCAGGGACIIPPGGCSRDMGTRCDPTAPVSACGEGGFCLPSQTTPGSGTCQLNEGPCSTDADCTAPARCSEGGQGMRRIVSPLFTSALSTGAQVFTQVTAERKRLAVAVAADSDGDELPDPFDNCPQVPNVDQADANANGIGDACEAPPQTPTRTPTRSATAVASATPTEVNTPTRSPTAEATATPPPTVTAVTTVPFTSDASGCAITPHASRGSWLLVIPFLLLGSRFRRRSGGGL